MDMIDQIGGLKSVSSIGCNYGHGYSIWVLLGNPLVRVKENL